MAEQEEGIESVSFLDGLISQETRRRTREQTQPLIDACCSPGCIRSTVLTIGIASLVLTALLITIFLTRSNSEEEVILNIKDPPFWMLNQATEDQLRDHLEFLSSDLLEGRAPGTRGEALAAGYIASHFRASGLNPVNNSFIQNVPMRGLTAHPGAQLLITTNNIVLNLTYATDFTADSDHNDTNIFMENVQMIFGGYCLWSTKFGLIPFPEDLDTAGKILVCLAGAPTSISDPNFSNVSEYYSSTSYKLASIQSLNVKGVLMIHTEQSTGYSWDVFQNRFGAGEQLALQNFSGQHLLYKGWIREGSAESIAQLNSVTLQAWRSTANSNDFRAFPLVTKLRLNITYDVREFDGHLVMGYLGPPPTNNSVLIMAHHDHLGIRDVAPFPPFSSSPTSRYPNTTNSSNTDNIYNGAVDNASGLAGLLAAAYAISALYKEPYIVHPGYEAPPLLKTVIFMTTTGKENMLGTTYFTKTDFCSEPLCGATIAFNLDVMNMWGKTYDVLIAGKQMSTLVSEVAEASITAEGLQMESVDAESQSLGDGWPFIISDCPSVTFATASDRDPNPVVSYMATKQYRPTDQYSESMDMEGLLQQIRVTLRMAYTLAVNEATPSLTPFIQPLLGEIRNLYNLVY